MGFSLQWLLLLCSTGSRHTGFSSCSSWALECRLSSMAHGFSGSEACGSFPDQGSNPCPLRWQVDSYPPYHQEVLFSYMSSLWVKIACQSPKHSIHLWLHTRILNLPSRDPDLRKWLPFRGTVIMWGPVRGPACLNFLPNSKCKTEWGN